MVTTIKIHQDTKELLKRKKKHGQSYNDVIKELIQQKTNQELKDALIQGYKDFNRKEFEEWDAISL